jgi:hypothetical protein
MFNRKLRTTIIALALAASTLGSIAGPAMAEDNGPAPHPGEGCPVIDENGNVSYVPIGTRFGLWHCGSDGEWHFGWLTDDHVAPPDTGTHHPRPEVADLSNGVLQVADQPAAGADQPAAPSGGAQSQAPQAKPATRAKPHRKRHRHRRARHTRR